MLITGVNDTGDKLFCGDTDTADKINNCHGFSIPMAYSGALGTLIYEKT
jgi:hypothetical protein